MHWSQFCRLKNGFLSIIIEWRFADSNFERIGENLNLLNEFVRIIEHNCASEMWKLQKLTAHLTSQCENEKFTSIYVMYMHVLHSVQIWKIFPSRFVGNVLKKTCRSWKFILEMGKVFTNCRIWLRIAEWNFENPYFLEFFYY